MKAAKNRTYRRVITVVNARNVGGKNRKRMLRKEFAGSVHEVLANHVSDLGWRSGKVGSGPNDTQCGEPVMQKLPRPASTEKSLGHH